jgi:small subunit ribosomal protein S3
MARSETIKEGRIPLHTFRADVDYCLAVAITKVGTLGIKTWICHGTVYGKRDLFEIAGASQQNQRQQQGNRKGNAPRRNRKNNK